MDKRGVEEINNALAKIYDLLGADQTMHFEPCASTAEGVAQVLYNTHFSHPEKRVRIALFPSAIASVQLTVDRIGERVEIPLSPTGEVALDAVSAALEMGVDLLSLSWADGLTGVVHPIEEIAKLCFERGVSLHVDGESAIGRLYFRLSDLPIDYFTFSGGLLIKERAPFRPLILGKEQPVPSSLTAVAAQLQGLMGTFDAINLETSQLRAHFEECLTCARPLFQQIARLPHIAVLAFPGVAAETMQYLLAEKGVESSFGGGTFPKLSHILKKMAFDPALCHTALSFTFTSETTRAEVDRVVAIISETYHAMKGRAGALVGGEL